MKIVVRIIQILVGVLFIISGLVKANDPMGLSFKMQEFFEVWNTDLNSGGFFAKGLLVSLFEFLHGHAVFLSVTMITLEVIAGVALLLGWRKKFVLWLLLVLIVFFSFLTAYAYLSTNPGGSPKFTNCGCFGDCLPLEPRTSFLKDLALLVMILILLMGQRYIQPVLSSTARSLILIVSLLLTLLLQWYVLNYLPLVDCLPFKKGNNLPEQMKPPKGAKPSIYETRLVYQHKKTGELKDMSQDEFNASKIWEDTLWKWKDSPTRLIQKGNDQPAINGFTLTGEEHVDTVLGTSSKADSTEIILSQPITVLGFGLGGTNGTWVKDLKDLVAAAKQKNASVYFSTNDPAWFKKLFNENGVPVQVFSTDFTIIRTAARANPSFYILKKGTVFNKYSYKQMTSLVNDLKKQ